MEPDLLTLIITGAPESPGSLDVAGVLSVSSDREQRMWPTVLVELGLSMWSPDGYQYMPECLVRRGLTRVRSVHAPAEPPSTIDWVVRLPNPRRAKARTGVFAPGPDGRPGGWTVITPLPMVPTEWPRLAAGRGMRCGVWVTTKTRGLSFAPTIVEFNKGLQAAADDGDVFSTTAVVLE
ncbi:MAG: hypothetical protein ABWY93_04730 [Mycobacterium sp.]